MKNDLLKQTIKHIDIKSFDSTPILNQFSRMAFQARNLANAAEIYNRMLKDRSCSIILCLSGSLFSAGLKKIVCDMIEFNMIDAIVSTGAIIVDQDFFESLGFKHYTGDPDADDSVLCKNNIDRIYDTYIDEDQLRICDKTIKVIADSIDPGVYSSREFINKMGSYLKDNKKNSADSVILSAFKKDVPIIIPAFSDSSAGFGLVEHQWDKKNEDRVSIDSAKDFLELTKIKLLSKETGLFMIGGGVPKNFAQDVTVSADIIKPGAKMHKYAIQITVADVRDGGLSGSTIKEAHSWGKVDTKFEQMVYSEATIALPLITSYAYHNNGWKNREEKRLNKKLNRNE